MVGVIRVGLTLDPPFVTECALDFPQKCPNPGITVEILYAALFNVLHLNISWILVQNYSEIDKGLDIGVFDFMGNARYLRKDRLSKWHFTPIVFNYGFGFVVKHNVVQKEQQINVFDGFTKELWILLLSVTLSLKIVKRILARTCKMTIKQTRFIQGVWFLLLTLMMETYQNLITVNLLTSQLDYIFPFNDLADLGQKLISKQCRLVMMKSFYRTSDFREYFFESTRKLPWAKNYRDFFKINPPIFVDSHEDIAVFVKNSTCNVGFDFVSISGQSFYSSMCELTVKMFDSDVLKRADVFYHVLKNLEPELSTVLSSEPFARYYDFLVNKYLPAPMECNKNLAITKQLTMEHFIQSFLLVFSGIAIAGFCTIMQHCVYSITKQIRRKRKYTIFEPVVIYQKRSTLIN